MSINRTNLNSFHPQSSAPELPKKQLTPDDFILLFTKQLTTQNPLHPSDSNTILQQMASASSIGAATNMTKAMTDLEKSMQVSLGKSEFINASQMVGKNVEVPSDLCPLHKGDGLSGSVLVTGPATNIKVTIKDSDHKVVKEITLDAAKTEGLVDFKWDGMKDDGHGGSIESAPGFYNISATATVDGQQKSLGTAGSFKVKSVGLNQQTGGVILNVDGLGGLGLNDIVKIL